ncbi:MAG: hypothetical protein RRA35_12345, partial [Desulfomonilia bacterium]|nr:hypothetical protein [Desulfomonilia bacterium]
MLRGKTREGYPMKHESVIVQCPRCKSRNRIPASRTGEQARCGKCHGPITSPGVFHRPVEVTDVGFKDDVLAYPGAVLV